MISWKGSLTVAQDTQLLGLWTQRDVTLLTSVLKFPGVLLCGLTSSQDSHWACLRPGNSPGTDFPPSLWKPFLLLLFGTISTISGLSQERGHLRDRTARNSFPVPQVWVSICSLNPMVLTPWRSSCRVRGPWSQREMPGICRGPVGLVRIP